MKHCCRCQRDLPETDFYENQRECKVCQKERGRVWRMAHPERMRELRRKYNEAHPEKIKDIKSKYRETHAEQIKEQRKTKRQQDAKHFHFTPYHSILEKCKRKDIAIMPKDDYESWVARQGNECFYCRQILRGSATGKNTMDTATIDRLDSNQGYVTGNIVLCCKRCNIIKGNWFTAEDMIAIADGYLLDKPY